jgi:hypothetical protein
MASTADQQEEEGLHATYSGTKQQIAALEQQLEDLRSAGAKHKLYSTIRCTPSQSSMIHQYHVTGTLFRTLLKVISSLG